MKFILHEKFKSKTNKKQKEFIRLATNVFYDYKKFKNGSYFKKVCDVYGEVQCYYRDNFYFEAIQNDVSNMTIVMIRSKNISKEKYGTVSSIRTVKIAGENKTLDKKIIVHPNNEKRCHISNRKATRNISDFELIKTVAEGIRVKGDRESYFYFANDIKVIATENEKQIRITTAIRVSTFGEVGLIDILPKIVDTYNKSVKDDHKKIWVELRDDNSLSEWKASDEFIKMKEFDAILQNSLIPDSVKESIMKSPGSIPIYSAYEEARINLIKKSAELRNFSYTYPDVNGVFSLNDFCQSQLSKSSRISVYFYFKEIDRKGLKKLIKTLMRLGATEEDANTIFQDSDSNKFIKISSDNFSGKFDERFGCKNEFSFLLD